MARRSRYLQELIAAAEEADRVSAARWHERHLVPLDPYADWRRVGGDLVHSLAGGGLVVLMDGPAGWFIVDTQARTFEPCDDPLPPKFQGRARRHGRAVYFVDEESARLAADTLPGYWHDPQENPAYER